jgi:hypothetical protein
MCVCMYVRCCCVCVCVCVCVRVYCIRLLCYICVLCWGRSECCIRCSAVCASCASVRLIDVCVCARAFLPASMGVLWDICLCFTLLRVCMFLLAHFCIDASVCLFCACLSHTQEKIDNEHRIWRPAAPDSNDAGVSGHVRGNHTFAPLSSARF